MHAGACSKWFTLVVIDHKENCTLELVAKGQRSLVSKKGGTAMDVPAVPVPPAMHEVLVQEVSSCKVSLHESA